MDNTISLIQFPSKFKIKVIGTFDNKFLDEIFDLVYKFDNNFKKEDILRKSSKNGSYLSLTLNIMVENKDQLDNIYVVLNSHSKVIFVL